MKISEVTPVDCAEMMRNSGVPHCLFLGLIDYIKDNKETTNLTEERKRLSVKLYSNDNDITVYKFVLSNTALYLMDNSNAVVTLGKI